MKKIFYADASAYPSSTAALTHILKEYFQLPDAQICKTENGKPYLANNSRLFFSVSHTKRTLFIAFSNENVGVDAELLSREVDHELLVKKFPFEEREEIHSRTTFLAHWTVRESAVKWLDGTLAHDSKKLCFCKNQLRYDGLEIPVRVTTLELFGHLLSVCCERDFTNAELIPF